MLRSGTVTKCYVFSLSAIFTMEVPRRFQTSSFSLDLPKSSSLMAPLVTLQKFTRKNSALEKSLEEDGLTEKSECEEETSSTMMVPDVFVDTADESKSQLSTQDSFSEDSCVSEESLAQEAEEARKKAEEEEEAAKQRAAQRQQLAIEELVMSEKNYLRMLHLSTVTIRNALQKLQVMGIKVRDRE